MSRAANAATALLAEPDACPDCIREDGLCGDEYCRRAVLPQLKQPGLVRLIGETLIEQTKRQTPKPEEQVAIEKIKRRNARKVARSQRRGYFGLAKAIMEARV